MNTLIITEEHVKDKIHEILMTEIDEEYIKSKFFDIVNNATLKDMSFVVYGREFSDFLSKLKIIYDIGD